MASDMYFNTEIRVYLADMGTKHYKEEGIKAPIEDIMECAEAQGNVMTLETFIDLFNKREIPLNENVIIRMAELDLDQYTFIREI